MKPREIVPDVQYVGAPDFDRRIFDSLIPLPDGTSYNSYLVRGREKTALIDAVEPAKLHVLEAYLADVPKIDYVISNHTEQDHSGGTPWLLGPLSRDRGPFVGAGQADAGRSSRRRRGQDPYGR